MYVSCFLSSVLALDQQVTILVKSSLNYKSSSLCLIAGACQAVSEATCPSFWQDGQDETISCLVNKAQWTPTLCHTDHGYNVDIFFTPDLGSSARRCSASGIDTSCVASTGASVCGCSDAGTHYNITYTVTAAAKASYEDGAWNCQPQCSGTSGINFTTAPACKRTVFGKYQINYFVFARMKSLPLLLIVCAIQFMS
jgi:hypothetical protein